MNIEELNLEYKNKMDKLLEEYKEKAKELVREEEPFIEKGQRYFAISTEFDLDDYFYNNDDTDKNILKCGNMFPYTKENREEVEKEVELIAAKRRLQSEMEMFARQNNNCEIDWSNTEQQKWYLYICYSKCEIMINWYIADRTPNTIYFASEEIAEKALEKFGNKIRELYLQEGEE